MSAQGRRVAEEVRARIDELAGAGERDATEYAALRARLDAIPADARGPRWRRASILTDLVFHQRPRKVLAQLRRMRGRMEPAAFDELWAECRRVLAPYTLGPHGYDTALDEQDPALVWRDVEATLAALRELGHEAFAVSGTLLGLVREGRLLGHDDDVDLAVLLDSSKPADVAEEWLTLKARLGEEGLLDPGFDNVTKHHCRVRGASGVGIDLFPAWIAEDRVFVWPHTHGELAREDLLPLGRHEIAGATVTLPRRPEPMLVLNYGAAWATPDPTYRFNWREAKARFTGFVSLLPGSDTEYSGYSGWSG